MGLRFLDAFRSVARVGGGYERRCTDNFDAAVLVWRGGRPDGYGACGRFHAVSAGAYDAAHFERDDYFRYAAREPAGRGRRAQLIITSGDNGLSWRQVPLPTTYLGACDLCHAERNWAAGGIGLVLHNGDGGLT